MSALCPQCGTSLTQDFGVVSCPQCQAVLAIDLDGHVQIQNAEQPVVEEFSESVQEEIPNNETEIVDDFAPLELAPQPPTPEEVFVGTPTIPLVNTSGGVISYQLRIEGIDTKDLRLAVEEALDDPKFPWNPKEIIRQTKNGILEIGPLNPVSTSVLVRKLKDLSINISWKQTIYE